MTSITPTAAINVFSKEIEYKKRKKKLLLLLLLLLLLCKQTAAVKVERAKGKGRHCQPGPKLLSFDGQPNASHV